MAIITEQDLYDYLGLTVSEPRLEFIALGIDAAIKAKVGMDIERTVYPGAAIGGIGDSGLYCGDNSRFLYFRQTPVNLNVVTGNTVNGSTTVSTLSAVTYLFAGQGITGSGIPDGTTISSVGATSLVLSQAATATATAATLSAGIAVWEHSGAYFGTGEDAFEDADNLLIEGEDYVWHRDGCLPGTSIKCGYEGKLERIGGAWPGVGVRTGRNLNRNVDEAAGNVKVAYVAGFPTIPGNVVLAALQLGARIRETAADGGAYESEKLGDYQYKIAQSDAVSAIVSLFNTFGINKRRLVA